MDTFPGHAVIHHVARRVRDVRVRRRYSVPELVSRLRVRGYLTITKPSMYHLEQGRRDHVRVDEWLMLAYVLNVSPLALLFPRDGRERVELAPGFEVYAEDLYAWLVGFGPAPRATTAKRAPQHVQEIAVARAHARAELLAMVPYADQAPLVPVMLDAAGIRDLIDNDIAAPEGD